MGVSRATQSPGTCAWVTGDSAQAQAHTAIGSAATCSFAQGAAAHSALLLQRVTHFLFASPSLCSVFSLPFSSTPAGAFGHWSFLFGAS